MFDQTFAEVLRLAGAAFSGLASHVRNMLRRADERRSLSERSWCERQDLGLHQVNQELNKWPWQL
jgi:hypothetical protein